MPSLGEGVFVTLLKVFKGCNDLFIGVFFERDNQVEDGIKVNPLPFPEFGIMVGVQYYIGVGAGKSLSEVGVQERANNMSDEYLDLDFLMAVCYENAERVSFLMEKGADPNCKTSTASGSALHIAVGHDNKKIIEMITNYDGLDYLRVDYENRHASEMTDDPALLRFLEKKEQEQRTASKKDRSRKFHF